MADTDQASGNASSDPEKEAKIAAMKAKIEAAKAAKGGGSPVPSHNAPAATPPAASSAEAAAAPVAAAAVGSDADKEAKLAAMKAKIDAAKAAREGGGVATATAPAAATATAAPSAPKPTAAAAAPAAPRPTPPAPPGIKPKQTKSDADVGVWYFGRRDFMQSIGWMSFFGFLTVVILGSLRAMFPRVIYEKPPIFKAGFPNDYVPGTVSEKYKDEERVWIIRQNDGSFIALLAICTHLGCTPRFLAAENKFKCPCHGSGFRGNPSWGINFEGPAPRPLERLAIKLAPDGQLEIDKSKKFLWEKGQWEDPAAMLKV
jgi:cytochrome b6-f complex iron-sulfur subunit